MKTEAPLTDASLKPSAWIEINASAPNFLAFWYLSLRLTVLSSFLINTAS